MESRHFFWNSLNALLKVLIFLKNWKLMQAFSFIFQINFKGPQLTARLKLMEII